MKTLVKTILFLAAFSITARAEIMNSETERAALNLGAQASSQIAFDAGTSDLKDSEKEELRDVVAQASAAGKISEIKIISWADREYPSEGSTAPNQQVKLAEVRADKIKSFLKKDLKVSDVAVYNMAKRPNALQELFNTQTAKVKNQMEATGAAPTAHNAGLFGLKGKASEALVLVYTK